MDAVNYEEFNALYEQLTSSIDERIHCIRCKVSLNSFFRCFRWCPMCRAPRLSKELSEKLNK